MASLPSTICLNMIVKNEAHIIIQTLDNLSSYFNFSYWVIGDNGSTDGTQKLIKDYFKKKNIKGELYEDKWVDFGYNRSEALKRAYNKTDYVFIFDADDSIHGDLQVPSKLICDSYGFSFGHPDNVQYLRTLLVNNRLRWSFVGVLHEYIKCDEPSDKHTNLSFEGSYYIVSGRAGSRNTNPHKYRDDARVLEKGYYKAIEEKDTISDRYVFYCAQSYKDAGMFEDAIKWYTKTLDANGWIEERYISCLENHDLYMKLGQKEKALYYLVQSHKYGTERVETAKLLIQHYCNEGLDQVAYGYYTIVQDYVENRLINDNLSNKLFARNHDYYLYLPYFMIIISERLRKYDVGIKMYEIIFKHKVMVDHWWHKNLIFNLQFFINKLKKEDNPSFFKELNGYLIKLQNHNFYLDKTLVEFFITCGLEPKNLNGFKNEEYKNKHSKKILIFAGFGMIEWNQSYLATNSLGGSETAVVNLSQCFPKDYEIYIGGIVKEETINNITYVNLQHLPELIKNNHFHAIIISRYASFFELYPFYSSNQIFIWIHDTVISNYGCNVSDVELLQRYGERIDKYVCLTEWHKNHISSLYPATKDKISIINNGLNLSIFPPLTTKIPNSFIYSSCSERGLDKILNLWEELLKHLPDAQLFIASYNAFPNSDAEREMDKIIKKHDSIHHLGQLSQPELYKRMAISEYWLYPTNWPETSCITSLEMLKNEVICLYYPIAGLVNTLGEYGIVIEPTKEIEKIISLTSDEKEQIKAKGRLYAESCSWKNRELIWSDMMNLKQNDNVMNEIVQPNIKNDNEISRPKQANKIYNYENDILILPRVILQKSSNEKDNVINFNKCTLTHEELGKTNKKSRRLNWVIFHGPIFNINTMGGYIENLNKFNQYHITVVNNNIDEVVKAKPDLISFFHIPFEPQIFTTFPQLEISCINTEPLSYDFRLEDLIKHCNMYPKMKLYDYSRSNIEILKERGITNVEYLPYLYNIAEINTLRSFYKQQEQTYDFGIIVSGVSKDTTLPISPPRRNKIVEELIKHFSVNIIQGWDEERDKQLANCKIILNIHGQLHEEENPPLDRTTRIFESIRCDRLLNANYKILSEKCIKLSDKYVTFYPNLKICDYDDFLNITKMKNILENWDATHFIPPASEKKKWVFYYVDTLDPRMIEQYITNLETDEYYTYLVSDLSLILDINPDKITLIINSIQMISPEFFTKYQDIEVGFLNIEPLNLIPRFEHFKKMLASVNGIDVKLYDYNEANITLLKHNNIHNIQLLPYKYNNKEISLLQKIHNEEEKTYDFGILVDSGQNKYDAPLRIPNRYKLVEFIKQYYSVNIIDGWGIYRDRELAKCKIVLNIHGQLFTPVKDDMHIQDSSMFEHIRCNRLLDAGFHILSEECDYISEDFVKKYPNLYIKDYKGIHNKGYLDGLLEKTKLSRNVINVGPIETIKKSNYCFIHSCNLKGAGVTILNKIITLIKNTGLIHVLDKIFITNIGVPIDMNLDSEKFEIDNYSLNPKLWESPSINKISHFSKKNPNSNILYLHTKGVKSLLERQNHFINIQDWTDFMLYFMVEKYQKCIEKLNIDNIDTVGCNYHPHSDNTPHHWSGNFWWANTDYLSTLPIINKLTKNIDCEFWLFKNNPKYYEMYNSRVNHYYNPFHRNNYVPFEDKIKTKKIIDGFIFYNELDLLKYRLSILYKYVDHFIIVEATHTHVGKEKPLNFQDNKHLFTEFLDKIIYVVVDDFPHKHPNCDFKLNQQWGNEKFQRRCIKRGIDQLNLQPQDVLLINDLDEIVNPEMLEKVINNQIEITFNILELDFYYYNLNTQLDHKWLQSKAITYKVFIDNNLTCDDVRFGSGIPIIQKAGWHLSYFGSPAFISNKLKNFTHQEYNTPEETNIENIQKKIKEHKDLFSRNVTCFHVPIETNDFLPPLYDTLLTDYYS